jgi:phenylacetate-CoA ligase
VLATAKQYYEKSPNWVRQVFGFLPQPFTLSSSYRSTARFLSDIESFPQEKKMALQGEMLGRQLAYALENIPFYIENVGGVFSRDDCMASPFDVLRQFPVIDKGALSDNFESLCNPSRKGKAHLATTGGSSGAPINILLDNKVWAVEWAYVFNLLRKFGVGPQDKRISLRGVRRLTTDDTAVEFNPVYKEFRVSPFKLTSSNINKISDIFLKESPAYVHGYPSAVFDLLALFGDKAKSNFRSVKVILLVSENLPEFLRRQIESLSGCPVSSFYGHSERACFAPWFEEKNAWIPDFSYGVTEIHERRIVSTGFINEAMPLVRYDTGDFVVSDLPDGIVQPGSGFTSIEGRWNQDSLTGKSGQKLTMTALNTHIEEMRFVRKFQFYQRTPGKVELRLVMADFDEGIVEVIRREFQNKCGGELDVDVLVCDEIATSRLGKHRLIVSEI